MTAREVYERGRAKTPVESGRDHRDALQRQVRRLSERASTAFDDGFAAAVRMVEAGADLEQLRAATGVVSGEWEDTEPQSVPWLDDTHATVEMAPLEGP